MKPVDMLHLDHGNPGAEYGDCLRCCVASILDLPAASVPHFAGLPDPTVNWTGRLQNFLSARGQYYIEVTDIPYCWRRKWIRPLVIAGGASPRGKWGHCVVGELSREGYRMIHDPHPSRAGLVGDPEDYGIICTLFELTPAPAEHEMK
jgi:hypothetical protein